MHLFLRSSALFLLFSSIATAGLSQTAPAPTQQAAAPASDYKDEALVFEHWDTVVRMRADGTGDRNEHIVLRIQSEGAVRQFGILGLSYASANAKGSIEHVQVKKPDGTTVATPEADAMETTPDITREAPLYSDVKQVQLPVRSLAAGDTLTYDMHTVYTHAETPDKFWGAERLYIAGVLLSRTFTLQVPSGSYVQVWSPNYKPVISDDHGTKTWRWTTAQTKPTPKPTEDGEAAAPIKDPDEDADGRKLPSLAWTTFHSWAEVGDWYRELALSRAQPDASIRERAASLTADAKTPEDQVRALYTFVATRTRYVGIDLGIGRFQPHAAAEVLSNLYGDCKDKDTLLEALLRAKGFTTAPALIGAGITPVPELPSPAVFNHVITTVQLPGAGELWMDSTAEVAPFLLLNPALRDEEALVVPASGPATLRKTPAVAPYAFTTDFQAEGVLKDAGLMKAHIVARYRDDDEVTIRALARNVAPAEWDKASQYVSQAAGFGGTTSNTRFPGIADYTAPATITYDYTRKSFGDWDNLQIVPLSPMVTLVNYADETKAPEYDINLGAPRTEKVESRIKLPTGWHTDLPSAVHATSKYVRLDKTYHFADDTIVTERTLTVVASKVPKAEWKTYKQFCSDAGFNGEPWIRLFRPTAAAVSKEEHVITKDSAGNGSTTVTLAPTPGTDVSAAPDDASVETLRQTASQQLQQRDYARARLTLDRLKAKAPETPYLNLMLGGLALASRNFDEAIADFRREIKLNPDAGEGWMALAATQNERGDKAEARQTLDGYYKQHPDNTRVGGQLAAWQMEAEEYPAAIGTLQTLAKAAPDNRGFRLELSNALLAAHRNDEAAAAAKSVLDGTDDPGLLNDAGYVLAELGQDLPQAEQATRTSIAKLESSSRDHSLDEVNSAAFAQSNLLVASWDTLGWILFREGKLDEARPYLLASWRNDLRAEVGDHMGQLDEAAGDPAGALTFYRLSKATTEGHTASLVREHIDSSLARLDAGSAGSALPPVAVSQIASVKRDAKLSEAQKRTITDSIRSHAVNGPATQELLQLRTYTVTRRAASSGWGTFRLQLTSKGVQSVEESSGEPKLAAQVEDLKALHFAELVPANSAAWLLRSGVLSCPSTGPTCELVLVPNATLATEQH